MRKHTIKQFAIAVVTAALCFCTQVQAQGVKTITLPNLNVQGIVANPANNRIYVVNNSGSPTVDDTISVIDGRSDTIVASIPVAPGAYYPAVNILTGRVYVASCNALLNPAPCFVTVIDGYANKVLTTIPVTTIQNGFLAGITVNPITNTVYVSDNTNQDIAIIDAADNTLKGTIPVDGYPWGLTINPFNDQLYVTFGTSDIDMIDARTKEIVQASTGDGTIGYNVAFDILTGHVFVTNTQFETASTTAVLSAKGKLLAQVPVGQAAFGVDVDPFTNLVFTANVSDTSISVINATHNALKATIAGTYGTYLSVNQVTRKVYAAGGNGVVTVSPE